MKKIFLLTFIAVMAFTMSVAAIAAPTKIIDEIAHARVDGEQYYFPGLTYTFPLTYNGGELDREFYNDYKISVSVLEGEKYIDTCRIERQEDDTYALIFKSKKNFSSNTVRDVQIMITSQDKTDVAKYGEVVLDIQLGYGDSDEVSERRHYVNNEYPILEFEDNLGKVTLVIENRAECLVSTSNVRRKNMFYSVKEDPTVVKNNEDGALEFLSFPAKPEFDLAAVMRMDTVDGQYVYEITPEGLKDMKATRNGNYLEFKTKVLGAYVTSDVELKPLIPAQSSISTSEPSSSSTAPAAPSSPGGTVVPPVQNFVPPPVPTPPNYNNPTTGGEFNPNMNTSGGEGIIINPGDKYNPQTGK